MKRKRIIIIGILFLIVFMQFSCAQVTELNVSNSPPILVGVIPNQSWPNGSNLLDAFNLDSYFYDPNGDSIYYYYTNIKNITVVINGNNSVSFFSDLDFVGIRNVTFIASDPTFNTSSNLVFLFVGADTEPPQWHGPDKNRAVIYQSMYVNFTTSWTDNFGLKSFYLSINQGSGWTNYPEVNFSGAYNISLQQVQISAAPGSTAYWKFCAYDTSLNSNCTEIQNFSVERRDIPAPPSAPPPLEWSGGIASIFGTEKLQNFTIEPDSFTISLKQGSSETRIMKITNVGSFNMSFNISIADVENLVFLSDTEFMIQPGQTKEVTVDFVAPLSTSPSQYFGHMTVESSERKYVPIIININALELDFSIEVEVPPKYKTVMPGESVRANISILNLRDVIEKDMKMYIAVKDFYGNIYDSSEESFVFNSSLFFQRNLIVPERVNEGNYIFYARAFTEDELALDSDSFEVGSRFFFLASLRSSFIFILIFIFCFVALILMVVYSRTKEKQRILALYLMLNELKNLIKEEKFDQAVDLYVRVKRVYGEPVSKSALQNRGKLKEEIKGLSSKLKSAIVRIEEKEKQEKEKKQTEVKEVKKEPATLEGEKKEEVKQVPQTEVKDENTVKKEDPKEEPKKVEQIKTEEKSDKAPELKKSVAEKVEELKIDSSEEKKAEEAHIKKDVETKNIEKKKSAEEKLEQKQEIKKPTNKEVKPKIKLQKQKESKTPPKKSTNKTIKKEVKKKNAKK